MQLTRSLLLDPDCCWSRTSQKRVVRPSQHCARLFVDAKHKVAIEYEGLNELRQHRREGRDMSREGRNNPITSTQRIRTPPPPRRLDVFSPGRSPNLVYLNPRNSRQRGLHEHMALRINSNTNHLPTTRCRNPIL